MATYKAEALRQRYRGRIRPRRLRLPAGQGTLVAAPHAALQHRAGGGRWHDAGRNAALLPATATEVRVTPAAGPAQVVPL
ncbi:hypothetical protein [Phytohabitans suffuscus]|uniref:Uncharacterized protein n=1 Tax=Phytohabitans suffuscus TaxID=624315 RepID=A0A6F8YB32_9ACTN|nr:hypothetical protein [Phytohabitans suffuscus]BCB83233.1 hypothetical protein Psuf_005460 [Phytohabitans suffuscus]